MEEIHEHNGVGLHAAHIWRQPECFVNMAGPVSCAKATTMMEWFAKNYLVIAVKRLIPESLDKRESKGITPDQIRHVEIIFSLPVLRDKNLQTPG